MACEKIEIGYWSIRGLGAPLRMMAEYAGAAYTAKCYDLKEKEGGGWDGSAWFGAKVALQAVNPLINLPYVKDADGTIVSQTNACFVFLGEKWGLVGATPVERARCLELLCEAMDLRNAMTGKFYSKIEDPAEFNALLTHGSLAKLEAVCAASGGPYLCGAKPTAADFHVFELFDQLTALASFHKLTFKPYPALAGLHAAMTAEPACARYLASQLAALPINNKMASFGAVPSGAMWTAGQTHDWGGV